MKLANPNPFSFQIQILLGAPCTAETKAGRQILPIDVHSCLIPKKRAKYVEIWSGKNNELPHA